MKYKLDNLIFKQDHIGNIKIYPIQFGLWIKLIGYLLVFIVGYPIFIGGIFSSWPGFILFRCFAFIGLFFFPYIIYVYANETWQEAQLATNIYCGILPPEVYVGKAQYYTQAELNCINLRQEIITNPKVFFASNTTNKDGIQKYAQHFVQRETHYFVTLHLKDKQEIPLFQTQGHKQGDLAAYLAEWIADTLKIPFTQVN